MGLEGKLFICDSRLSAMPQTLKGALALRSWTYFQAIQTKDWKRLWENRVRWAQRKISKASGAAVFFAARKKDLSG